MPSRADPVDQPPLRAIQRGQPGDAPSIGRLREYSAGVREETSLLGFINVLLRYRTLLIVCAIAGAVILGLSAVSSSRMYAAYASFTVRGVRARSAISDLAAQLGLTPGADQSQSAAFYIDLVSSNVILEPVASASYTVTTSRGAAKRSLASLFGIHDQPPAFALSRTVKELRSRISASGNPRTAVISVAVKAPSPELGRQILQNVLQQMDAYYANDRRQKATAERDFVEKMLNDAGVALAQAEERLSTFRQVNREYQSSPALTLENDRLTRGVRMRQQIYTAMQQSFEQARIEELRDLPSITVLDRPEEGTASDKRTALQQMLFGLIAGLMVGIVLAFIHIRTREIRKAGTPAYNEYSALKKETVASFARPWRAISRTGS